MIIRKNAILKKSYFFKSDIRDLVNSGLLDLTKTWQAQDKKRVLKVISKVCIIICFSNFY
jgi:hypothetical protein